MKKIITAAVLLYSLCVLASCNTKTCVCYEVVGQQMTMQDTYTDINNACSSLSTERRICVEESERVNPEDVAWK